MSPFKIDLNIFVIYKTIKIKILTGGNQNIHKENNTNTHNRGNENAQKQDKQKHQKKDNKNKTKDIKP